MRLSFLLIVAAVLALVVSRPAGAQQHFKECVSRTDHSASIIIPVDAAPTIAGTPVQPGDEIAVFTKEGVCAGTVTWQGISSNLAIWGDDQMTPEKDGYASGETLVFRLWDASEELEYTAPKSHIEVQYSDARSYYRTENTYRDNAIFVVRSLSAVKAEENNSSIIVPVEENHEMPDGLSLGNYPNPFNPATTLTYTLEQAGDTTLEVFDVQGRVVQLLADGYQQAGSHEVRLDAGSLPSGVYLARLTTGQHSVVHRMALAR